MANISHSHEQRKTADVPPPGDERPAGLAPHEAQALAHPSRRGIAEALGAAPEGLAVAELATRVGLHPNAVRQHLEVMRRAGVVTSGPRPSSGRRGRPSVRHQLAAPHGVAAVGHRELVRLLLELVRRAGTDEEGVEVFGWEQGRRLLPEDSDPGALPAAFAGLGFAPEEVTPAAARERGEMDLRLRACPFQDAVLAPGGELICALHRGLVRGALERVGDEVELAGFEIKDPVRAGCRVHVKGLPPR